MKTVIVMVVIALISMSGCKRHMTPEQQEFQNASRDCWKARKEYYCKNTEDGLKRLPKELVRTGLEIYFGADIPDQCAKEYATWGYDYRAPLPERLELHCGARWHETFWGEKHE